MDETAVRRAKVHAVAGIVWPTMILGSLVLIGHASVGGRDTFLPYAERVVAWAPWALGLFGTAFLLWAASAVALRFPFGAREEMRRLRRFLAVPVGLFALAHGWLVWGRVAFGGASARYLYVSLQETLSQATVAWLYAFGIALTALQLEQSAQVLSETFDAPRRERDRRWYRGLAIVLSVTLFGYGVHGLAALIGGEALFRGGP